MWPAFTQWRPNFLALSPTWPPRWVTFLFGKRYTNDNPLSFTKLNPLILKYNFWRPEYLFWRQKMKTWGPAGPTIFFWKSSTGETLFWYRALKSWRSQIFGNMWKTIKNCTISNVLTHSLLEILLKMRFHAIWEVFWSLSGCKELKVIQFVALWSRCEMLSSGVHREQKFEDRI